MTGAAPSYTTIMAKLQYGEAIKHYYHGTPYHWDIKQPTPYGYEEYVIVSFELFIHLIFLSFSSSFFSTTSSFPLSHC
jgi:hypothetical protein